MRAFSSMIPFSTSSTKEVQQYTLRLLLNFELRFSRNMVTFFFLGISTGHRLARLLHLWKKVIKFSPSSYVEWHKDAILISLSMLKEKCLIIFLARSPHDLMSYESWENPSSDIPTRLHGKCLMRYVGSYAMSMHIVENSLICSTGLCFPLYLGKFGITYPCGKGIMYNALSKGNGHKSFAEKVLLLDIAILSICCWRACICVCKTSTCSNDVLVGLLGSM